MSTPMVTIVCATCYVTFGVTEEHHGRLQKDKSGFYCPNGHTNVYKGDKEVDRLKKELAETRRKLTEAQMIQHTPPKKRGRPRKEANDGK